MTALCEPRDARDLSQSS